MAKEIIYTPIVPLDMGVGKDNLNTFALKYTKEIANIYNLINNVCTYQKIKFSKDDEGWKEEVDTKTLNKNYTLEIVERNQIAFAVFRIVGTNKYERVVSNIDISSATIKITAEAPFDGFIVSAYISDEEYKTDSTIGSGSSSDSTISCNCPSIDSIVTEDSDNLITSGAVYDAIEKAIEEHVKEIQPTEGNGPIFVGNGYGSSYTSYPYHNCNCSTQTEKVIEKVVEKEVTVEDIKDFPTAMPASDVYDWAKQPTKPRYTWNEIYAKPDDLIRSIRVHIPTAKGIREYAFQNYNGVVVLDKFVELLDKYYIPHKLSQLQNDIYLHDFADFEKSDFFKSNFNGYITVVREHREGNKIVTDSREVQIVDLTPIEKAIANAAKMINGELYVQGEKVKIPKKSTDLEDIADLVTETEFKERIQNVQKQININTRDIVSIDAKYKSQIASIDKACNERNAALEDKVNATSTALNQKVDTAIQNINTTVNQITKNLTEYVNSTVESLRKETEARLNDVVSSSQFEALEKELRDNADAINDEMQKSIDEAKALVEEAKEAVDGIEATVKDAIENALKDVEINMAKYEQMVNDFIHTPVQGTVKLENFTNYSRLSVFRDEYEKIDEVSGQHYLDVNIPKKISYEVRVDNDSLNDIVKFDTTGYCIVVSPDTYDEQITIDQDKIVSVGNAILEVSTDLNNVRGTVADTKAKLEEDEQQLAENTDNIQLLLAKIAELEARVKALEEKEIESSNNITMLQSKTTEMGETLTEVNNITTLNSQRIVEIGEQQDVTDEKVTEIVNNTVAPLQNQVISISNTVTENATDITTLKEVDEETKKKIAILNSDSTTEGSVDYKIAKVTAKNDNDVIDTLDEATDWIANEGVTSDEVKELFDSKE